MYFPNKNDEWYTLPYAIEPILEFLKPNSKILCPFDTIDCEYVNVLKKAGHKVSYRHIKDGFDFFDLESGDVLSFDYIISNPPYSLRKQVFIKLEELNKPFAMLVPLVSIALKPIREKIQDKQLLIFDKRIKFKSNEGLVCKNPPSETAYICKNILPKQIIFKELLF
ncbi:sugar-phospahte nucleotidyltransferase [Entomoplasma ellychniae]|uniref:Sugar-phospahte nucleotidyltransferase n=1 Tax=Entomoplasma ellychniae TaxID=2114 RepID=A0A8E2UE08_9MOLU|nr:sugar-phospahte nucleotidyltransferase [Entomoplasma ellychniae]PPE04345.1 sugar-phospahte nucleotidyltransferase [Entomoplasma ellychniae]PPE04623.1 sugar-phospahte nucleotidyltransferase [Entomoplasma ellychniae]PPE04694.1 sugar-phospahte nucleotidyltransferase [Entomoplasma ellychniae]